MTVPNVFANGVGNYPDATKFNANFDYLEVLARKNRLINGNFAINQRQATSVADDAYCLDRWYVLTETGNVTVAQMTDVESGTATSVTLYNPNSGSSGSWRDYSASTDKTVTGSNIGESGLMVAVTSSVDGNATGGHYVAEIEL